MKRFFNTAGPCNPQDHYMLDALARLGDDIFTLVEEKQYFVIHAPRQSGKTTLLIELTRKLNAEGRYYALYCSLENLQGMSDSAEAIPAAVATIQRSLKRAKLPHASTFLDGLQMEVFTDVLQDALEAYCGKLDKPLVILFDEADCLSGKVLISFLRQLRNGYVNRAFTAFAHSLALVGMRNIRDYRDEYRDSEQTLGSASPFNVTRKTMFLRNFTPDEVKALYDQHTSDTGQIFAEDAVTLIFEQTQGQPWLVNAIASECVKELTQNDFTRTISSDMAEQAIQNIILRRDTHIDSLMARLREERVRRVIEPMLVGQTPAMDLLSDDYSYVRDLGLIRNDRGATEPGNPIYAEVMTRTLNWNTQADIEQRHPEYEIPRYLQDDRLDADSLLKDFQVFWRENAGIWEERYDYKEAAPHLVLMAFLQRVVNGGGQLVREYAASTGRTDLCLIYAEQKYPIELKLRYSGSTRAEGLEQLGRYMDTLGVKQGWLVIFDRRNDMLWEDKLYFEHEEAAGKIISVVGC
jgi:type II secretory pathway predicted ATPase ExeA